MLVLCLLLLSQDGCGLSVVSLLLEVESLVFLHLVRLESQFHKPHNQFRKLILVHFSVCLEGHHC